VNERYLDIMSTDFVSYLKKDLGLILIPKAGEDKRSLKKIKREIKFATLPLPKQRALQN
jgi:hypothetical protein